MTLYDILGVSSKATQQQIKKAYRDLVKKLHPDHNNGEENSEFLAVQQAYEILSDPNLRAEYDRTGELPKNELNPYDQAVDRLASSFRVTIEKLSASDALLNTNPIILISELIEASQHTIEQNIVIVDATLTRLENYTDRFTTNNKTSFLINVINNYIASLQKNKVELEKEIKIITIALDILSGITFTELAEIANDSNPF